MSPFISICIPAYKNAAYLRVLLDSIAIQTYKDFEVVVSDDSPDIAVEVLCNDYIGLFSLTYFRNVPAKGSPANWNAGIAAAKGEWIKIMHDDDWFSSESSMEIFANAAENNPEHTFIFSGYNLFRDGKLESSHIISKAIENRLKKSPLILFRKNYIGHPSTTLIKNTVGQWYDESTKWVVDFEFYIRCLDKHKFIALRQPLVSIGMGDEQITRHVFRNIKIEIPENFYLLEKLGQQVLDNIIVYDYYWRLLRNLGIRKLNQIIPYYPENKIPGKVRSMLAFQSYFPLSLLKVGVLSKILMFVSYIQNRIKK